MFILITSTNLQGQSNNWGKSDRDNLYNDCISYLSSNYKHLTNEQKETMSLCFLDQITAKYKKDEYNSKIEIEVKRLRSAVIEECAKTHGISLNVVPEPTATPVKANWKKEDKDAIYKSCLTYISKVHKQIDKETVENICLCQCKKITNLDREEYGAMLEIEKKRTTMSSLNDCANASGIDLSQPSEPTSVKTDKPSTESLKGHWKDKKEDTEFWLNDGGNFTMIKGGKRSNGTWRVTGEILTLYFDKLFGTKERSYEILMFSAEKFVYQSQKNGSTNTVEKLKG